MRCRLEGDHTQKQLFIRINNIGSRKDGCTIYDFEDGIYVRSGCFFDNIDKFEARVRKVHGGTAYEKEYLAAIVFAKICFNI